MLILGIDANSFAGSVALLENSKLLAEVNMDSFLTHSERLLPSVDLVLGTKKLKIRDIDGFALAVGPGSFTGIRIGMSTVKSLALAAEKPVAPVSNLAALAYKLRQPQGRLLCPLLDARKSEVYGGLFKFDGKKLVEVIAQGVYFPDSFFSKLPDNRVIHFIGTGVEKYKKKIFQYFKDKARFPLRSFFIAYEVGLLGYEHLKTGGGKIFVNLSRSTFANLRRRKNIIKAELPQTSFFLRLMEERDLPFVIKIERLSFSHPWLESTFKGEINNRGISFPFVVVHRQQDKIIGYIIFWLMGEKAQISNFAIHPDFRRLGVGEKVLTRITAQIKKYEAKSVILEVRPSNFAARRLYRKYGFKSLGMRKAYYRDPEEDALVMVKYFSPS